MGGDQLYFSRNASIDVGFQIHGAASEIFLLVIKILLNYFLFWRAFHRISLRCEFTQHFYVVFEATSGKKCRTVGLVGGVRP